MPPAWKIMAYAAVVLVLFAVATTTWAQAADPVTLALMFVSLFVTVGLGYYLGRNLFGPSDGD